MFNIDFTLNEDKSRLLLAIPQGHNGMELGAGGLEVLIAQLADLRAQMEPAVPTERSTLTTLKAVKSPTIGVGIDSFFNLPMLALRDPRYGWLAYLLQPDEAMRTAEALMLMTKAGQQAEAATRPTQAH